MTFSVPDYEIVQKNFHASENWEEKYKYLIQLGKKLPGLEDQYKIQDNKVIGCVSNVWVVIDDQSTSDQLSFNADSDAAIVKGLIMVLFSMLKEKSVKDIVLLDVNQHFSELGLGNHLSPNRTNGFFSLVAKVKRMALEFASLS